MQTKDDTTALLTCYRMMTERIIGDTPDDAPLTTAQRATAEQALDMCISTWAVWNQMTEAQAETDLIERTAR